MKYAWAIEKETNDALKKIFKSKIHVGFLIKIKDMVLQKMGSDLINYYDIRLDTVKVVTGSDNTIAFDICRMIVGIHRHYSIFISEEEIRNNQKNKNYQERIADEVVEKIRLRSFGNAFFRRQQLIPGDEFLYFPVPYELFVLCTKSLSMLAQSSGTFKSHYFSMIHNALSCLTLIENNFLSNAYPLCRGMIEQYLKYLVLKKHPESIERYEEFCHFEIRQSCCEQKYPTEFLKLYNQRKNLLSRNQTNYLHYGWLDIIEDYKPSSNFYSIYGIMEYLINCGSLEMQNRLQHIPQLYKMCHGYTHGSATFVRYPLLQYFEISTMLYSITRFIFVDIHNDQNAEMKMEDKKLLLMLERDFALLEQQYQRKSTEAFELYYKTLVQI